MLIDRRNAPLDTARVERWDVAKQHGERFLRAGYRGALPREVTIAIKYAFCACQPIEVMADGVVLHNVAKMPAAVGLLQADDSECV